MTKPIHASELGLEPHWKVRVVVGGAILHLASRTEPEVGEGRLGQCQYIRADWIEDEHEYGDTLGFIDLDAVQAVTWRFSP